VLIEPGTIRSEFEERTLSSLAPFRAGSPYAPACGCDGSSVTVREPERGANTGLKDGVGFGAVGGRACELQRTREEPHEGRRVCAAQLLAPP